MTMFLRAALFAACLLSSIPAVHAAEQPLVPLDSFVREDDYYSPRLSPDGKYLAITARIKRGERFVPTIVVYSLPDMKQMSATQLRANEVPLSYTWVSNTRMVVSKGKEYGSIEAPFSTGEVLGMDYDGGKQTYLYGWDMQNKSRFGDRYTDNEGQGRVAGVPRKRNGRYYLATDHWEKQNSMLYDADAMTGVRKLVATIDHASLRFVLQQDGTPRFAVGMDKVKNEEIVYRRDDASGAWRLAGDKDPVHRLRPFAFSADDSEFLAMASPENGPDILVRQDTRSGKSAVVFSDKVGSINEYVWGNDHDLPIAAGTSIGIPSVRYLNEASPEAALHKMLSAKFPGHFVDFINYTDDHRKLLFLVRSDREPGAYFLYDRSSGKAFPLFAAREQIDPAQMAERRPIKFNARDGLELHGYITLPNRADGKKPPLILLPHGGPHGPYDTWFYDNDAQFLASRGYAVLQVNFRGSGGRGESFERAGYRQWGAKIQDDLIDGVKWSIAQGLADGGRVCAYGTSFGGYSALMVTVRAPELFKCAVGYAGVYDLNLFYKEREAASGTLTHSIYVDYIGKDKDELDRFSPVKQAAKITVPVLLVHGKEDKRAVFEHAEAMRAALQKAGRDPEWMAVPDEGHGFYATRNVTAFYEKLEAFLGKHLK
jgi:dienelactone hydrolase